MSQDIIKLLARKLEILEEIAANTERQGRFVKKRQLTGLGRLLRERETLIEELAGVVGDLRGGLVLSGDYEVHFLQRTIKKRQSEILDACRQVLQSAQSVKADLFTQLHSARTTYQLNSQYIYQWERPVPRSHINAKA